MKVRYTTAKCEVEVEGADTKDCFTQLAGAIEVFANAQCGSCDSQNTMPQCRENGGNHFYSMKCIDCGAELNYGQRRQDGGLFPKRKDKEGSYLPANGWTKWAPKEEAF
jgi:Zn ribbon nucleic-acid-binding protein